MGNSVKFGNCVFCNIILQDSKKEILYENDKLIILNDINPGASIHLLAIPKRHIKNVNYLIKDDIPLLRHMEDKVKEFLMIKYGKDRVENLK